MHKPLVRRLLSPEQSRNLPFRNILGGQDICQHHEFGDQHSGRGVNLRQADLNPLLTDSDIDILVEFERPVGFVRFMRLEKRLAELLGMPVDLVTKKALKPHIGKRILQEVRYV